MNGTPIDDAVAYIAGLDPGFPGRIFPATAHEIADLEAVAGAPLPPAYRGFLERMGHGLEMPFLPPAHFDIQRVIARYRHGYVPPPGFWMIGRAKGDPYYDVYLYAPTGAESRIVSFPPPPVSGFTEFARKNMSMLAGNLVQWLCCAAFEEFRYPLFDKTWVKSTAAPSARKLAACETAITACGLTPLWFSDDWKRIYEGPYGIATATEFPGTHTCVFLQARDQKKLAAWATAVEAALST